MACPSCAAVAEGGEMPPPWRNPQVVTSTLSGVLLVIGFFWAKLGLSPLPETGLYILSVIIGGWYFGREAMEELVREREIGIELLMSVAAVTAGLMGQWVEAAMLVFLYSISESAEGYTEERSRNAIRALMDLAPKTALVQRDGKETRIPVEELLHDLQSMRSALVDMLSQCEVADDKDIHCALIDTLGKGTPTGTSRKS